MEIQLLTFILPVMMIEVETPDVQVPVSISDEEDCYITDSQEIQSDPNPYDNVVWVLSRTE